jgi:hypothetical protein
VVITVYRYDDEDYRDGEIISSRGDHYDRLTGTQQQVELVIRRTLPKGENVRRTSLYTWEDRSFARLGWEHRKRRYLYELEVDEADIRFHGDLQHFSDAEDAIKDHRSPHDAVARYCSGENVLPPRNEDIVFDFSVKPRLSSERGNAGQRVRRPTAICPDRPAR